MLKVETSRAKNVASKVTSEVKKFKPDPKMDDYDDIEDISENIKTTQEVEIDDYVNFDTDTFGRKKSKLQKKVSTKQSFKNNLAKAKVPNHNEENKENSDETPSSIQNKKPSKSKNINGKREAVVKEQQFSSNWLNLLKKQKQGKDQAITKNSSKKISTDETLTPLRPIPNTYKGPTPLVALDCEMVLVQGNEQALARCSIVNYNGHCLFDKLIRPTQKVENYLPKITGLSYTKLKNAGTFEDYKDEIYKLLEGRKIIGHTLKGDFEVLKISPDEKEVRDLSHYRSLREDGKLIGLKKMVEKHLKFRIQTAEHDSVEDARAAMALYRMFEKKWENELKEERIGKKTITYKKVKKVKTEKKEETDIAADDVFADK